MYGTVSYTIYFVPIDEKDNLDETFHWNPNEKVKKPEYARVERKGLNNG